jgi:transcriptional regulator with XRE-family HTH domain
MFERSIAMNGKEVARIVDSELASRGMSKAEFYAQSGVSSATMSQWRTGKYEPTPERLAKIEKCLGISFAYYEKSEMDDETADLLQSIRERQDLRILLHSAKDVPASSVYALISQIERMKEDET